jgi:hypothetical protein
MELNPLRLAAVAAVGGFLAFGGAGLAGAQESDDSSSTTTVVGDDDATTDDATTDDATTDDGSTDSTGAERDCPHGEDAADESTGS